MTNLLLEDIESPPYLNTPWPGAIDYRNAVEEWLETASTAEDEDIALAKLDWINSKNIWQVGQGVKSPSIFFIIHRLNHYVEISWNKEENLERGFLVPQSDTVFVAYQIFYEEIDKFLKAYEYKMKNLDGEIAAVSTLNVTTPEKIFT